MFMPSSTSHSRIDTARASRLVVLAGFTLVELLVVIGIIAVLIAVLLPALKRAKEQADQVYCMANMRTLGQAVQVYQSENKNAFPPAGLDSYSNHIDAPHIWTELTNVISVRNSAVRYCPTMANLLPFQDLTVNNFDGKPCFTTRVHVGYLYNKYLGGLDNRLGPWQVPGDGLSLATAYRPVSYRSIPAASETMLFMEYPQLVVVCAGYESAGMDRGMVNVMAYNLYSGNAADPLMITVKGTPHQVMYAVCPAHFIKPSTAAFHFITSTATGQQYPTKQGYINVTYADGHVASVFVQQGQTPGLNNNVTRGDVAWALDMSTQNGAFLPGSSAVVTGTRYDPYRPW
jgi:prepilin-type N-terminal cleavage/methylation domain-containing protein/prepilin-type processing-associated H-X9-DG protein